MKQEFTHLHAHSEYSVLDAFGLTTRIVEAAKSKGFTAYSITDHGSCSGALQFYNLCKEQDIKPIIGVEMYFTDDRFIKPRTKEELEIILIEYDKETQKIIKKQLKEEDKKKAKREHIVLLNFLVNYAH